MPRWLAPTPQVEPEPAPSVDRNPVAASEDLRYGLFQSGLRLLPEDGNTEYDVYRWTPDGVRLVSRDLAGSAAGGTVPRDSNLAQPGAMSSDGSRIFFQHVGPLLGGEPVVANVFMLDGDEVRHISPRRGGDTPDNVAFVGASADGDVVYLQTNERLTPEAKEAGSAIYRYDVGTDTLSLVATDPAGAYFLGLSADVLTVVYRTDYPWELRVTRAGSTTALGILDAMDVFDYYTVGSSGFDSRGLRIAPDGSSIVFNALGEFDGMPAGTGRRQVYRWTPGEGVRRLSAAPDDALPTGDANIGNFSVSSGVFPRNVGLANTLRKYPMLGASSRTTVASSSRRRWSLVPADVNGYIDL